MNKEALQHAHKVRNVLRQKMRTDLLALCQLLGYSDVCQEVHGPILDMLPKFPGGEDVEVREFQYEYRPFKQLWQLGGAREFLVLYPRGHLKTTLVSQAHLIQWIINYPDIRILLSCATGDQVEKVIRAVKGVFQFNEDFRAVFPEFCPPREKSSDFGSRDQFIVPARKQTRGEPTVFSVTVGKTIAGYHPDVIFHSDLVDKENVKTPGGITDVIEHFKYMNPLLERYSARDGYPASKGFTYVEGTPYVFGDLHDMMLNNKEGLGEGYAKVWKPAAENYPTGKILWEARFPLVELEALRKRMGDWMFSSQYLMKCVPDGDGLCDPRDVAFVPGEHIRALLPRLRLHCTVDLAGMEPTKRGDYTVLTVGGFDHDGRLYIPEIHCGNYSPEQVIDLIFAIHRKYPNIDFKVEKDAHARVLLPFLQREMSKRGRYPIVIALPRDTHTSKQHRIRGLRPWFKGGIIRFNNDLPISTKQELLDEIAQFPSESAGIHDDILDTLADQMQNADGDGVTYDVCADASPDVTSQFGQPRPRDRFMGFGEQGIAQWLYGPDSGYRDDYKPTGVL